MSSQQRLGEIRLPKTEDEAIEPFDWCVSVIEARERALEEVASASAKAQELEDSVNQLKKQVDKLIKAKEEGKTQLLKNSEIFLTRRNSRLDNSKAS